MMNKWKYEKSTELVNQKCDEQTVKLWNRLNFGHSTNSKMKSSQSLSKDMIVGWWNLEEMKNLKKNLPNAFDSIIDFNDWDEMRKNVNFSGKNKFEGIEYVYDILDIGINENQEVIFYNENE